MLDGGLEWRSGWGGGDSGGGDLGDVGGSRWYSSLFSLPFRDGQTLSLPEFSASVNIRGSSAFNFKPSRKQDRLSHSTSATTVSGKYTAARIGVECAEPAPKCSREVGDPAVTSGIPRK